MNDKRIVIDFSPRTIIWAVLVVLAIWFVYVSKEILIILFLSYIFAAAVNPLVNRLEKKKIPRPLGIFSVYLLVAGFLGLFFWLVIPPAINEANHLIQNSDEIMRGVDTLIEPLGIKTAEFFGNETEGLNGALKDINYGGILSGAAGFLTSIFSLLVVFVIGFYLLLQRNGVERAISHYLPAKYQKNTLLVSNKIASKMSRWVRGQILLAFIIFAVNYIALTILGVEYALVLAVISGFLELLPIIGPIIAGVLAALVALTVSPLLALIVAIWYILVQQLENHLLVPQIMRKAVGVNPIVTIVALLIGGKILGIMGVLIAVPVVASITVVYQELIAGKVNK